MNPKAFISYSWSSEGHQKWVLRLATELRESGVDVTLDIWDLKEGHDAHAFMEQMVTDPTVEKVIMVCDKIYMDKANARSGGVGTEAQIITPELYGKQQQDKLVAIIAERDREGNAYLPAFFKSRIYIDLSDDAVYSEGFEKLLRWAFDKPQNVKPMLGAVPGFLTTETVQPVLPTAAKFRRAIAMLRGGQAHAGAAASEYFSTLVGSLEAIRIKGADFTVHTFDDAVVKNIEEFLPYRNECATLFDVLAKYGRGEENIDILQIFFEGILSYTTNPEDVTSYQEWDYDNFRFIVHELFLIAVATLMKQGKFSDLARFLESQYYVRAGVRKGQVKGYGVFAPQTMRSLQHRNQRLDLHRISVHADLLKERCKGLPVEFDDLMQADFVMFLRARLTGEQWWPVTTVFMGFMGGAFEVFARSKSRRYFDRIAPMLGVVGVERFQSEVRKLAADGRSLPQWDYHPLPVLEATGIDQIGTIT